MTSAATGSGLYRKRACITGASGGLGIALSWALAQEGCKLLLSGRNRAALSDIERSIADQHDVEIDICVANLALDSGVDGLLSEMEAVGGVDILINNAGIFPVGPLTDVSREAFDACFAINVRAPFLLAQGMIRQSRAHGHGWGRVVNIGSSSAYAGFPDTAVYCGSKHALLGLSRSFFAELRGSGFITYSVNPGSIKTEMGRCVPGQDFETFLDPIEVANFVVELLKQQGNMVCEEVRLNRAVVR